MPIVARIFYLVAVGLWIGSVRFVWRGVTRGYPAWGRGLITPLSTPILYWFVSVVFVAIIVGVGFLLSLPLLAMLRIVR